jgi:energy-coupling factor transporter ATP-binding protein EcfA2
MGNFFERNDVEEIKNELLKTLKSVPQEREKVEQAVSLAIKDVANIRQTYKFIFAGTTLSLIGSIVYIAYNQVTPWSPKKSLPLFSREFEPLNQPTEYFPRNKIEQNIKELLNKSQLIIVYGPKTSGKSTTVNQVLNGRKGVIRVSYQKETNLIKELGRILKIPTTEISLNMVETIFQEFKEVYGSYPIVSVDINGQYDISMEQWVRDGRHLTEGGKGVCDCIIQFSDEDASLAGLVETSRSKYIQFGDISKKEAIDYMTTFDVLEPEKILEELKTTRIGALQKVVDGDKDEFLLRRNVEMEFVFNNKKNVEILREINEGKLKKVVDVMKKLGIQGRKKFFQHDFFTMHALIVDIENFTVSLDSEFVEEKIKNFKEE